MGFKQKVLENQLINQSFSTCLYFGIPFFKNNDHIQQNGVLQLNPNWHEAEVDFIIFGLDFVN